MSNIAPSRADPMVVFPRGRWCPPQETSQPHPPHGPIRHDTTYSKARHSNAHFSFLLWMEHCGIWNRCILGFVKLVHCDQPPSSSYGVIVITRSNLSVDHTASEEPGDPHLRLHPSIIFKILRQKKSNCSTVIKYQLASSEREIGEKEVCTAPQEIRLPLQRSQCIMTSFANGFFVLGVVGQVPSTQTNEGFWKALPSTATPPSTGNNNCSTWELSQRLTMQLFNSKLA